MMSRLALLLAVLTSVASAQELNFLTMGDWGHPRDDQQAVVARTMAHYVASSGKRFDAMLTAGDNFYVPLEGIHDPRWTTMFEQMYDPKVFDFPFYVALGNHDYERDRFMTEFAYAQANPWSRWKMPARWYRLDLPQARSPLATVIVLDSSQPMVGEYGWKQQTEFLKAESEKPRAARWVIALAHHPFFSNGDHGDNGVLQREWGPPLAKAGADFYICGHDLQHLQIDGHKQSFLLVGGGGATTRPIRNDQRGPFSTSAHGFAHLQLTDSLARVRIIHGRSGKLLHEFTRARDGKVTVIQTSPSDPAQPRTVASVTRGNASQPATAPVNTDND